MLIEENGVRILTDPGSYSTQQSKVRDIDFVLITHDHSDHLHIESLKVFLKNNPQARVMTSRAVGEFLTREGIDFSIVGDGETADANGVGIEGFGTLHAVMHSSLPQSPNTGYFIAGRLFYPGDAWTEPGTPVELLALPVAGPWTTVGTAIDYALRIGPKTCFPVHDSGLKSPGAAHAIPPEVLGPKDITFTVLEIDKEYEF